MLARLRSRAEEIARAEVERTLAALGDSLTDKQRKSIEAMGRAIVNKLLHEPTVRMKDGPEFAQTVRDLFDLGPS